MKIERINQNKIKITLSCEDLREWDIDIKTLSYDSTEAQDIFWSLIKMANDKTDFFSDGAQLVVEAVMKNGNFIMLVTKVDDIDENSKYILQRKREIKKRKITHNNPIVFFFSDLETLSLACKNIENRFVGKSSLYKYNSQYFLVLNAVNEYLAGDLELLLIEFGQKAIDASMTAGELSERGTELIPEEAVADISSYL